MNGEPRSQALKVLSPVPDGWPTPEQGVKRNVPTFETVSPTYVIRVSREKWWPSALGAEVLNALRTLGQGADITKGYGVWGGTDEPSVTVTVQATDKVLAQVLDSLARVPGIRWAHVEKHEPKTAYVDLETRR